MRLYAMCTGCGRAIASGMGICHACRRAPQLAVSPRKKKSKNHNARKPRRQHD